MYGVNLQTISVTACLEWHTGELESVLVSFSSSAFSSTKTVLCASLPCLKGSMSVSGCIDVQQKKGKLCIVSFSWGLEDVYKVG